MVGFLITSPGLAFLSFQRTFAFRHAKHTHNPSYLVGMVTRMSYQKAVASPQLDTNSTREANNLVQLAGFVGQGSKLVFELVQDKGTKIMPGPLCID